MKILKTSLVFLTCAVFLNFVFFTTVNGVGLQNNDPTSDENSVEVNYQRINEEQTTRDACRGLVCCSDPSKCNFGVFVYTIGHIIRKVLEIAFVFIAVMFAYAGFKYMTSQGDTGQIQAAHDMFKKAAVGMIITLCSFLIIELITSTLGLDESIIKLVK